ncbi:MAG TPA: hypothetical protein DEQ02_07895 [Ruminococcaceae bacterium]|nr:hypothetical protein [Oscillospiraceae bacterium]
MENHAGRDEVKYIKPTGVYIAMRESSTLGERYMYASVKAGDGNILRLAYSYSGFFQNLAAQFPAILTAVIISVILALILARWFSKSVTRPLEKMVDALSAHEYDKLPEYKSPYYEIDKMMYTLRELLQKITDSNLKLQDEREKVDYIISNMAEGFVLLDGEKNILLCNISAREFFSCGDVSKLGSIYNLTRNPSIIGAIQSALDSGQSSMFELKISADVIVNIYVSPMPAGSDAGVTMLIVDMTAEKKLLQQKRDFFSNASHELKTPITSILGFSEMLGKGIVTSDEEKSAVIKRIETEAKRLSELISDILTISKLESSDKNTEYADIDLSHVVNEAVCAVSPFKDGTAIEINTDLRPVFYRADKRQIYELMVNLIENAVKYNNPGGKVFISLKSDGGGAVLTVRDTGIGISPEHQARVFERFFRVDYGRDKKVGGTGLGLSIVKHIVNMYGGRIALKSQKGTGTTITVFLPAPQGGEDINRVL